MSSATSSWKHFVDKAFSFFMAYNSDDDLSRHRQRLGDVVDEPRRMLPPIEGYQDKPLVPLEEAVKPLIKHVPNVENQALDAKKRFEKPSAHGLTVDESASIWLYTMEAKKKEESLYYILNANLRSEDRSILKDWFLYLKLIITGLVKIPSTCQRVLRGVSLNLSMQFEVGESIIWWGFSSTTTSMSVVDQFCGKAAEKTVFEIDCYSGKDIGHYSKFPAENEILLIAATQFQIVSNVTNVNGRTVIQLKETEPKYPLIYKGPVPNPSMSLPQQQKLTTSQKHSGHIPKTQQPKPTYFPAVSGQDQRNPETCLQIDQIRFRSKAIIDRQSMNRETMKYMVEQIIVKKQCPELEIHNVQLTPEIMLELGRGICKSNTLNVVDLRGNRLSNNDVSCLIGELSIPQTYTVQESGCCGFTTTKEMDCGQIKVFNLGNNDIDDDGMKHIVTLLRLKRSLIELHLDENQIGDEGIQQLATVLSHPTASLQKLYLQKNKRITDQSVDSLVVMLKKNRSLTTLWLDGCSLSDSGKQKLVDATKSKKGFYAHIERFT